MKKLLSIISIVILAVGISACASADNNQNTAASNSTDSKNHIEGKFVVGLDDDFPPMGFRDDNNEIVGFDIDLAKAAAEKLNCEVEFQPIDWDSKELELESGNIDCIWNGLTITPDRKESMEFSKPYLKNKQIIIVNDSSEITSKNDLEGKKVGVQAGSSALEAVNNDEMSAKIAEISEYDTNILAFTDLKVGRIDAVVADEVVARYYLTNNDSSLKVVENGDFGDEVYGVAAKKGNTQFITDLQSALDEMAKDGTATEISIKWFGEDIYQKN